MPKFIKQTCSILLLTSIASLALAEPDDWELARKASCDELVSAYKDAREGEQKVMAAIKDAKNETVGTNVLGAAMFATVGFGFFSWNDNASAEENLAELRNEIKIITTVSAEKKCVLPAN